MRSAQILRSRPIGHKQLLCHADTNAPRLRASSSVTRHTRTRGNGNAYPPTPGCECASVVWSLPTKIRTTKLEALVMLKLCILGAYAPTSLK